MNPADEPNPADGAQLPQPPGGGDVPSDDALRASLGALNPVPEGADVGVADVSGGAAISEASEIDTTVDRAWARVEKQVRSGDDETGSNPSGSAPPRRRWWELAAAACLGAALVGGSVFATQAFYSSGADSGAVASGASDAAVSSTEPYSGAAVEGSPPTASMAAEESSTSATAPNTGIARSASGIVATEDPQGARDSYVATITGLGGRVTSETVTSAVGTSPVEPMPADAAIYPPIYSGAGIYLDLEVPAPAYDQAIAAIAPLGEVIEFSQSSYDTGTSIAEGEARIAALQASLTRLQALLTQAANVNEIIELENAISARQSELDALTAQQRYLTSQVEQSRISLRLVTPADAETLSGAPQSWWGKFTAGLADAWMWLGRALAWTSPLWIAGLLWWLIRRRRARRTASEA